MYIEMPDFQEMCGLSRQVISHGSSLLMLNTGFTLLNYLPKLPIRNYPFTVCVCRNAILIFYGAVLQRQDYLHRELTALVRNYSNIAMMPSRFATIWGGANLATMLLSCMEYMLKEKPHWQWDFFLNLSESDFPIR